MDVTRELAVSARGTAAQERDSATWEEASRRYDPCHPRDTFADLSRRSSFSKEDRRLMEDWLAATEASRG